MKRDQILNFSDLAKSVELEKFYTAFWKLTNMPLALVDAESKGNYKLFCPEEEFNPICRLFRKYPKAAEKCITLDGIKMKDAARVHKGICYKCHAGLMDFAVPIYVGKRHIATINCGQIMTEVPTDKGFDKLWANVSDLSLDKQATRTAYFESAFISPDKIDSILQLLSFFATYFCEVGVRLRLLEGNTKYPEIRKAIEYLDKHLYFE